jgi:hypothetical protein
MAFKIVDYHYWEPPIWGYYSHIVDFSWQHIKMKSFANPGLDYQYFMGNTSVIAFSDFDGQWWIGADFLNERKNFELMGPYADHEEAVTIMVLHSVRQEMF